MARARIRRWGIIERSFCASSSGSVSVSMESLRVGGLSVLALPILDIKRRKITTACCFCSGFSEPCCSASDWTINGRSIFHDAAVAILLLRNLEPSGALPHRLLNWSLGAAAALSLLVSFADYRLAESARTAVHDIALKIESLPKGTIWFQGHWGVPILRPGKWVAAFRFQTAAVRSGDLIVLPFNNHEPGGDSPETVERLFTLELPVLPGISTMSQALGAGFYSDKGGRSRSLSDAFPWRILHPSL